MKCSTNALYESILRRTGKHVPNIAQRAHLCHFLSLLFSFLASKGEETRAMRAASRGVVANGEGAARRRRRGGRRSHGDLGSGGTETPGPIANLGQPASGGAFARGWRRVRGRLRRLRCCCCLPSKQCPLRPPLRIPSIQAEELCLDKNVV